MASDLESVLNWFESNYGSLDSSSVAFTIFPASEGGRGMVALKNIPEGHTLFTIPRSLTLSTRTSCLPMKFGLETWKKMKMDEGWVGLILCMMWETTSGNSSKWSEYLASLPAAFDTPMFWNQDELKELEGTAVVDKIGRADAEQDYREKLLPAIQFRPDLFPPHTIPIQYSLDAYHIMGSRILSRSFNVEKRESGEDEEETATTAANASRGSGMDIDSPDGREDGTDEAQPGDDDEDDENGDSSDIAMVPMADMLNARYGTESAKLFYEKHELRMVSTKPIAVGEQIWNTYGDLPNSELLRRYGHVDLLPLPRGGTGNPGDVVEIRADLIVSVVGSHPSAMSSESSQEKIDWWLEEGGDDVFVLEYDLEIPPALISLARLLLLPAEEWKKTRNSGKPPKPKMDASVLAIVQEVLERRLKQYPTNVQEDEEILSRPEVISLNKKHATIVRLGEKLILVGAMEKINLQRVAKRAQTKENRQGKRKSSISEATSGKKPRI